MSTALTGYVVEAMLALQLGVRALWHALGLSPEVLGQPAWPFAQRLAAEALWWDPGHARRVALTGLCLAASASALLLAFAHVLVQALRRRPTGRWTWGLVAVVIGLLLLAPWPAPQLLWAPAAPTSLHHNPLPFTPQHIVQGQRAFAQHCAQCHGSDARGEGPLAAQLPQWPPDLTRGLVWKRLEGELFAHIRHGMHDVRSGRETMPGIATTVLPDDALWAVLHYLQAQAAGQTLRATGVWERPVRLPQLALDCRQGHARHSDQLQGLPVLLALPTPGVSAPVDPRYVTVGLDARDAADADCLVQDPDALPALAVLLGLDPQATAGQRLLTDRQGWLRARAIAGQGDWSEDDLVCRSDTRSSPANAPTTAGANRTMDGLDALLRGMARDPVQVVRAGFPHR